MDPEGAAVDPLLVGDRLMAAGEAQLALRAYTRALAARGDDAEVLSALGSANLKLGRLGQAEVLLRRATEADPRSVPAWNNLGVVLMERGQTAEAARVFRLAFGLDRGESDEIRNNHRTAVARRDNPGYDRAETPFALVSQGAGRYRILATQ